MRGGTSCGKEGQKLDKRVSFINHRHTHILAYTHMDTTYAHTHTHTHTHTLKTKEVVRNS